MHENFHTSADQELLTTNGFGSFADLWEAELNWFEPPNFRRSGWSGAARYELHKENGEVVGVFIKRQENHLRRTWRYPKGCPTFRIEWQNLKKLTSYLIEVPRPLYYGERNENGRPQAILITYELKGYKPLDEWLSERREDGKFAISKDLRRAVLPTIADLVRRFHNHRFRHNALYPKHIMLRVRQNDNLIATDVSLIDLEKSRRVFSPLGSRIRDLDTLFRRCPEWSDYEKDLFFNHYLQLKLDHLMPKQLADALWKIPLVKWVKRRIAGKLQKK